MKTTRRIFFYWVGALLALVTEFLQGVKTWLVLGGGAYLGLPRWLGEEVRAQEPPAEEWTYNPEDYLWGYGIDIEKCIGCGRCVEACKLENGVPLEPFYFRTWVERYAILKNGQVIVDSPNGGFDSFPERYDEMEIARSFFVPKMCNHCEDSPCSQVCPVGATYMSPDGVVLIDKDYCIGCRYCIQACPYGCRFFNPETNTAEKCTLCYHRITRGMQPACVEVCPTGARLFGNLKAKESPIRHYIDRHRVGVLKEHLGTKPKLFYNGLDREVH